MTERDDDGPAFPFTRDQLATGSTGMSLRDWFAGQALAGLIAGRTNPQSINAPDQWPARAYEIADLMLAERQNRGSHG